MEPGDLVARLLVDPAGAVERVQFSGPAATHAGLVACVESALRRMTFPTADGPTDARVTLSYLRDSSAYLE